MGLLSFIWSGDSYDLLPIEIDALQFHYLLAVAVSQSFAQCSINMDPKAVSVIFFRYSKSVGQCSIQLSFISERIKSRTVYEPYIYM